MKLRRLTINNFRGIKHLDWKISNDMICLIGAGDSTKTTILDAIEILLSPRWYIPFNDLDFYQSDPENPIEIRAIITNLPNKLIQEDKFGLFLCFWNSQDFEHEEEKDGDELGLVIKLRVDESLEPQWSVLSIQTDNEKNISSSDRELLGVSQIGAYVDRDLSWGRNSILMRLTGKNRIEEVPSLLAKASRNARLAIQNANFDQLLPTVQDVERAGKLFGVIPKNKFRPGMDPLGINLNIGAITLLDGNIPLRSAGLGSRRLLVSAIQKECSSESAIILIDEIENGLEPFRLRNLIRYLRPSNSDNYQCLVTTHSDISIVEFEANEIFVVLSNEGVTTVSQIDIELQDIVRRIPEAFLARKIIVCEGKTEWGVCRAMDDFWQFSSKIPFACLGIEPICSSTSGGSESPKYALALAKLGYKVVYFGDSDVPVNSKEMESLNIKVILWSDNKNIENRLCIDIPIEGLQKIIELAIDISEDENKIWNDIKIQTSYLEQEFENNIFWLLEIKKESEVRKIIGNAANKGKWFKSMEKGYRLGKFITEYYEELSSEDIGIKLNVLQEWCYADH